MGDRLAGGAPDDSAPVGAPRRRRTDRLRRTTALTAAALALPGCYAYAPVTLERAPVGADVRVRLTEEEAVRLNDTLGRTDRLLEGTLVETSGDRVIIAVPTTPGAAPPGMAGGRLHQRVDVRIPGLVELERRRLDRLRTGLLVGGAAAIAGYIIGSQFVGTDPPEGIDKTPDDRLTIPVFTVQVGGR